PSVLYWRLSVVLWFMCNRRRHCHITTVQQMIAAGNQHSATAGLSITVRSTAVVSSKVLPSAAIHSNSCSNLVCRTGKGKGKGMIRLGIAAKRTVHERGCL